MTHYSRAAHDRGVEAAAPLAEEAKDPKRTIRRAVVGATLSIGALYIFTTYAVDVAFGPERFAGFMTSGQDSWQGLARSSYGLFWVLVFLAIVNSTIANANAGASVSTRTAYALGRIRLLPRMVTVLHPTHRSPYLAVIAQFVIGVAVTLGLGFAYDPVTAFLLVATVIVLVVVLVYILCNLACIGFFVRKRREDLNPLLHTVVLELWTEDCFAGKVRSKNDLVSIVCDFPFLNPQTGPFFIEGAEPGDTLAVHFVSIEPSRDWAASTTVPLFGALTSTHHTATLQPPLPELVWMWQLDRTARTARFTAIDSSFTVDLPMDPMHGTVGVAPANLEVRSALTPDAYGGNMDTPEMRAGTTCFLGVNVDGALFSLGDGHARQGEGETCGVAVECAMDTVVIVDLVKGRATPWPRIESDTHIMSTGSARPLEDAFRIAQADLVQWVAADHGLSLMDAYQLVSQAVESPLANVCDTNYTSVAKLRKQWLPDRTGALTGVHDRLRDTGRAYLAQR